MILDVHAVALRHSLNGPSKINNEDLSHPFYQLDLSGPNYENMPLSQNSIGQFAFVRGIMRIIKAINNDDLADELSYH